MKYKWTNLTALAFALGVTACSSLPTKDSSDEFTPEANLIERTSAEAFEYYCANGKQKRSLKINLVAKLIEPDKTNKSLEKYSDELRDRKKRMRTAIKNIFLNGRHPKGVSEVNEEYSAGDWDNETNIYGEFIYPYLNHAKYFIGKRKVKFDPEFSQQIYDIQKLREGYSLRMPISEQHKLFKGLRTNEIIFGEKTSLRQGIGFKFDNLSKCLFSGGTTVEDSDCSGHFSSDQALRDQSSAWELIINQGTQVQESPDQETLTFNYLINLDLNIFCTYGIPSNSLMAH